MRAIGGIVVLAQVRGRLGERAARPPSADGAGDSADQCAYWSGGGAKPRSEQRTSDSTRCFADLVADRRVRVVLTEGDVLRPLEPTVHRSVGVMLGMIHWVPRVRQRLPRSGQVRDRLD